MKLWIVDPGVPGVVNLKLKGNLEKDNVKTKLYYIEKRIRAKSPLFGA